MGMCANLHQFEVNNRPSLSRDIISAGEAGAILQPVLMGKAPTSTWHNTSPGYSGVQ